MQNDLHLKLGIWGSTLSNGYIVKAGKIFFMREGGDKNLIP